MAAFRHQGRPRLTDPAPALPCHGLKRSWLFLPSPRMKAFCRGGSRTAPTETFTVKVLMNRWHRRLACAGVGCALPTPGGHCPPYTSEVPGLLNTMQERMLALAPGYFGHGDFAARFIRKKFADQQALEKWQRLDTRGDRA